MSNGVGLRVRELAKSFELADGRVLEILRGVSLDVAPGESAAVTGVSGSGKTTLLHIIAGIEDSDAGTVELGASTNDAEHVIVRPGLVFQHHYLLPELTALENAALAARISGMDRAESLRLAAELLARVGLAERAEHLPSELSGGEMARVAIARALATNPAVLLADEPTGNLDAAARGSIQQLLLQSARDHRAALVFVTHDDSFARLATKAYRLENGLLG